MSEAIRVSERRRRRSRGAEIIEFTLMFLPMMAFVTVLTSTAYAIWAKATLERAVRVGVRRGVTLTATDTGGSCLTDVVRTTVQSNAMGLLQGTTGLNLIKVNFYQPPDPSDSTGAGTDVTSASNGNAPGNVMTVSVQGFSLVPLMPRMYGPGQGGPDNSSVLFSNVTSSDRIEPSKNLPCKGTAP